MKKKLKTLVCMLNTFFFLLMLIMLNIRESFKANHGGGLSGDQAVIKKYFCLRPSRKQR